MIRINLLPHRAEKRRLRRQQFYAVSVATIVLGALIGLVVHVIFAWHIESQEARNAFLKAEIATLDRDIAEIRRLKEQIDAVLARKQVIEALQSTRAETVHIANELAQRLPEGIYLKSVKQVDRRVTLVGFAQSNARISNLMRNVESSDYLNEPRLVEAKAVTVDGRRVSEFTLSVGVARPKPENTAVAPARAAKEAAN